MDYTIRGRIKTVSPLTAAQYPDRYNWLSLDYAEPNLGYGNPVTYNSHYVLATSGLGDRFWTKNLNLTGGSLTVTTAIIDILSAGNLDIAAGNLGEAVIRALSAYSGITVVQNALIDNLTAFDADIRNFTRRIPLLYLDQSGATRAGQVPIWNGIFWYPDDKVLDGFPGVRVHDFVPLSGYAPGLSADYSFCGTATSGSQVDSPAWKITRLRYSDAGLVDEMGIVQFARWVDRYTANYTILINSDFYFNTFGA
jgi:hypothetical protein